MVAGMGWRGATSPAEPAITVAASEAPVAYREPADGPGLTSDEVVAWMAERHVAEVQERIASAAEGLADNKPSAYAFAAGNARQGREYFGPGTNKCNCLVADALLDAGLSANGATSPNRQPNAGEYATGSNLPAGFELVADGGAPMRGDIVAQERDYRPSRATGHAAIMTSETSLIQATGAGVRTGTLGVTFPSNYPKAMGPVRFVRYTGAGTNPWVR
jgi:hypothetical protein